MSSFEINKIVGAVLLAVLSLVVIGKVGDNLVSTGGGHGGGEGAGHGGEVMTASAPAPKKPEPLEPIVGRLASASADDGQKVFNKCKSCHTVDNGGKNGIGPNLWGIVGRQVAGHEGFGYSDALKAMSDKSWTYSMLNGFLHKPRDYAKGTKMTFAGLSKVSDRADVVAYLRTLSDSPAPLPTQAEIDEAMKAYEEAKAPPAEEAAHATATAAPAAEAAPQAAAAAPKVPVAEMVAQADADKGKRVFNKCKACHTIEQGGKNGIGPNLWKVVGRQPGTHEGFKYSDALTGLKDPWTLESLSAFLLKPKDYAPGTKMTFVGLKKDSDRANLLAFLQTLQ